MALQDSILKAGRIYYKTILNHSSPKCLYTKITTARVGLIQSQMILKWQSNKTSAKFVKINSSRLNYINITKK